MKIYYVIHKSEIVRGIAPTFDEDNLRTNIAAYACAEDIHSRLACHIIAQHMIDNEGYSIMIGEI